MNYKYMLYEEKEQIGILTLNRPEKRNALGHDFEEEIIACLSDAGKRCDVKVIIIKAAGDIFCAGHDRMEILNQPLANIRRLFQTSFNLMTTRPGTGNSHGWWLSFGRRLRSYHGR